MKRKANKYTVTAVWVGFTDGKPCLMDNDDWWGGFGVPKSEMLSVYKIKK